MEEVEVQRIRSNLPAINQLELSPFNRHQEIVQYCDRNDIAVGCSAWSKTKWCGWTRGGLGGAVKTLPRQRV